MDQIPFAAPGSALFFDFDGTLIELAARPDQIVVAPLLQRQLGLLAKRQGGALAVVSGRPLSQIDHWLQPLVLPVAGVHGSERRAFDGRVTRLEIAGLDAVGRRLEAWASAHPQLLVERKPAAIALHFRGADELEAACVAAMSEARDELPEMSLMRGKKVLELKPKAANKGAAMQAFLAEAPFSGRTPYFFGDDVTDEAGFEVVQALGGVAVKVGAGETLARHRIADPAALLRWIDALLTGQAAPQAIDDAAG